MAEHQGASRESVVDAARAILVAEGPDAVTMRRLAADLGTSYQVVYSRVGGKPEVLRAVHDAAFDDLTAQVLARGEAPGTDEHLHALTRGYLDFAVASPRLFDVMFGPATGGLTRDAAMRDVERESFRGCWVAAARAWLDVHHPQRPRGSAAPLAWRLWSATHGITVLHLAGHESPAGDPRTDLATVVGLLLADPLARR
ncbi:TetR/AcrR family transcriptional regulator [Phycicoccus sp. BSK3Z-2]|uniref:TetR/AcrR family transcriptional regulator n=1 Tax=Phycicoccus avicenniae TaxID=2828860 RepID=A0A941I099_9MICO|nr:TetR/AcrR family transcriptional regulator [Phycicoccus avicenniae]MBR7743857.1 TetR/AcrR family transcriptional regulator [Phycicoccus avicenniae]